MPAALVERVFEPFVQGERPLDRSQGGLGIGLTLVRRLAELHGGTASAASEGPGKGSVFTVRIPAIEPPATKRAPAQPAPVEPRDVLIVPRGVPLRAVTDRVRGTISLYHFGQRVDMAEAARPLVRALRRGRGDPASRALGFTALARIVARIRDQRSAELSLVRAELLELARDRVEAAASPVAQWTASLEQAKSDLVARDFSRALLRAETVLRQTPAPGVRAAALLLSADAAYGLRAYTRASERYREFLSMYDLAIEAPQATLALGWAELRLGQVDRARRTWMQLARRYPLDDRAPLA